MAFTKLFTFAAKHKVARHNAQVALGMEDVLAMAEDVHVRMHVNKKGELVPYVVEHVNSDDVKPQASRSPSSATTLVGTPTLPAPSFVHKSKEIISKPGDEKPEVVEPKRESDNVSLPTQLTGAFKDADAPCDLPVKHEHITSRIRVVRALSSGTFGEVFLVQDTETGKLYALKVISKAAHDVKMHALVFEEQDILRRLAGRAEFLNLQASFEDEDNFYLLTEYYPGGDLFDKIAEMGRIPETQGRPMAARIMVALEKLHEKRIIHRDIKPENILFDDQDRPVVADFGLCRQFGRTREEQPWRQQAQWARGEAEEEAAHGVGADRAINAVGTAKYLAPEVWRGEAYSYGVDVWSFGVMVYLLLLDKMPFGLDHVDGDDATAHAVLTRELVVDAGVLSSDAEDFLHTVLVKDPLRRPTWEQLKEHPWFDELDWSALNDEPQHDDMSSEMLMPTSSVFEFGELYSSGDEPHPYFEWYGSAFETHIPQSTSDNSVATLPSTPSLKWLPEAPSTTKIATSLPALQSCNHRVCDEPALATYASQFCLVEYEVQIDSHDTDDDDEYLSCAYDGFQDLDDFEILPLDTLSSGIRASYLANPSSTPTTSQGHDDPKPESESEFNMIPFGLRSPAPPATRSSRSTIRAQEEAPASPARDARSIMEQRRSEDSTCLSPADQPDDKLSTVRRSDTPSQSTSDPDPNPDELVPRLRSSDVCSYSIFRSCSRGSTSSSFLESLLVQSDGSSLISRQSQLAAHSSADAIPTRLRRQDKLTSWLSWLGARCSPRVRRLRGNHSIGG